MMEIKKKDSVASSIDPDEMSRLIWIYSVWTGIGFGRTGWKVNF